MAPFVLPRVPGASARGGRRRLYGRERARNDHTCEHFLRNTIPKAHHAKHIHLRTSARPRRSAGGVRRLIVGRVGQKHITQKARGAGGPRRVRRIAVDEEEQRLFSGICAKKFRVDEKKFRVDAPKILLCRPTVNDAPRLQTTANARNAPDAEDKSHKNGPNNVRRHKSAPDNRHSVHFAEAGRTSFTNDRQRAKRRGCKRQTTQKGPRERAKAQEGRTHVAQDARSLDKRSTTNLSHKDTRRPKKEPGTRPP